MAKRKWDIFLVHHSHTDIGYTARQEKIVQMHADFIRQAIEILDAEVNGKSEFKWQCENFWQVQNFLEQAEAHEIERFNEHIKQGNIGLSAIYLNLTDLVDADLFDRRCQKARNFGKSIGIDSNAAMIADINGLSWGMADLLPSNGIKYLYSCLHSHHGMFPLGMKQRPFFWTGPKEKRLLVWNGEHYHFGNELCLAPRAGHSYMIRDEFTQSMRPAGDSLEPDQLEETELNIATTRLKRYLDNLVEEDYPFDFVPIMVSGVLTDNAPPSADIQKRISDINRRMGGSVNIKMATLNDFFTRLESVSESIPDYRGDWTDWWADGVSSTPTAVSIYKDAQRKNRTLAKLIEQRNLILSESQRALLEAGQEQLMLFSEHTWGYSASVSQPWSVDVALLDQRKQAYATNAHAAISQTLDQVRLSLGEASVRPGQNHVFRIMNPHRRRVQSITELEIEYWDSIEGKLFDPGTALSLFCRERHVELPYQIERQARVFRMIVPLDMTAGEELTIEVHPADRKTELTAASRPGTGADGIDDLYYEGKNNRYYGQSDYFELAFAEDKGIVSLVDRRSGAQLIHPDSANPPFSGVSERTHAHGAQTDTRRKMGRNRKSPATRRNSSVLTDLIFLEDGAVYSSWQLDYELEGCPIWQVQLRLYKELPLIDVSIRIHKESCWDPENVYAALPFTSGLSSELWMDKTAAVLRPGIDQLPGSNESFWLGQNGLAWLGEEGSLLLVCRDSPMLTLGSLEAGPVHLNEGANPALNRSTAWNWLMNNFWETNFKAEVGGFYQFDYRLKAIHSLSAEQALGEVADLAEGLISYRKKEN